MECVPAKNNREFKKRRRLATATTTPRNNNGELKHRQRRRQHARTSQICIFRAHLHGKKMILVLGSSQKVHLVYMEKRRSWDQLFIWLTCRIAPALFLIFGRGWLPLSSSNLIIIKHILACLQRSSLISIPQTDISLFIQLTRRTIYFRLQIYFNETNILNKLRRFTMECFHVTSRRPCWCPKTKERRPCWCPQLILRESSSFIMQTFSFVSVEKQGY